MMRNTSTEVGAVVAGKPFDEVTRTHASQWVMEGLWSHLTGQEVVWPSPAECIEAAVEVVDRGYPGWLKNNVVPGATYWFVTAMYAYYETGSRDGIADFLVMTVDECIAYTLEIVYPIRVLAPPKPIDWGSIYTRDEAWR